MKAEKRTEAKNRTVVLKTNNNITKDFRGQALWRTCPKRIPQGKTRKIKNKCEKGVVPIREGLNFFVDLPASGKMNAFSTQQAECILTIQVTISNDKNEENILTKETPLTPT